VVYRKDDNKCGPGNDRARANPGDDIETEGGRFVGKVGGLANRVEALRKKYR
jgi:hypothetical protein